MRLFLIQCCADKKGNREIFSQERSVLADLPATAAAELVDLRSRVRSMHADKFGGKRLTALALYTGYLYTEATKRLLLDPPTGVQFLIMSGGYGLLRPNEGIRAYNVSMDQTYSVWKAGLPAILGAYVYSNGIPAVHAIVSRTGSYKKVLDAARRNGVPITTHAVRYTGDGALRAVPTLQAKLLAALVTGGEVESVDGVPVERDPGQTGEAPLRSLAQARVFHPARE